MTTPQGTPSIADINVALAALRRLMLRMLGIVAVGLVGALILGQVALVAALVGLIVVMWIDGRIMGRALQDPALLFIPPIAILSAPGVIAQHAHAAGMEWTGFFGPLRPARRR